MQAWPGSVRGIYLQDRTPYDRYAFDPYGQTRVASGIPLNVGYTGHLWDACIQQYFAPFRYYNPAAARWTMRDPLGMVDGPNMYGYVGGNTIQLVDSLGLTRTCIKEKMTITAYCNTDKKTKDETQPAKGIVAVGRKKDKKGHITADSVYPMGSDVTVCGEKSGESPSYTGTVHDTGKGFAVHGRKWDPRKWIDIWMSSCDAARTWGVKKRIVIICWEEPGKDDVDINGGAGMNKPPENSGDMKCD